MNESYRLGEQLIVPISNDREWHLDRRTRCCRAACRATRRW
ncbi:MAG: hypothetical protein ACLU37_11575 [Collinsella sp.]